MVRIDNIVVSDGIAACKYYPENKSLFGEISIDVATGEIKKLSQPEGGCLKSYIAHARSKLYQIIKENAEIPVEAFAIWY